MAVLNSTSDDKRIARRRTMEFLFLFSLLPLLALSPPATAQDDEEGSLDIIELSLDELLNVEITSVSKKPEKRTKAAAAIFVLTQEDIRRSGATNIPDLLRLVPGLNVARIDSHKWSITARGSAGRFANKLLVLIDGRSVYTPFFSGVYWEANDVMLEDVDRIEVIRGPGGTLWGANAVNGVINIVTKRAEDTQGGLLSVGGGTEEQGFGAIRYGGKLKEIGHYRGYLKFFNRGEGGDFVQDDPALSTGASGDDEWQMGQGGFRIDLDTSEQDQLTIQGDIYTNSSATTQDLVFFSGIPIRRIESTTKYKGWNVLARWNRTLSDTSDIQLQFFYDHYNVDDIVLDEQRNTFDLEFQHRFEVGERNEFIWGAGYRLTIDDFENTSFQSLDPDSKSDNLFSAFIQDQITLTERLKLTIGTKIEHNDYSGFEIQPSLRMAYTPNDRHTLWGAVSRAVRTPSRADRDIRINFLSVGPGTFVAIFGDDNFDSEEVLSAEVGYRVAPTDTLAIDITTFYNEYENLRLGVAGAPHPEGGNTILPFSILNGGGGNSIGFEVTVDYRAKSWWFIRATYAFLDNHFETPQAGSQTNGDTPEQQFTLLNRFDMPHNLELDTILRFVDRLPDRGIDEYVTIDAQLTWRPREDLELTLVGRNLLEAGHPEFTPTIIFTVPTEVQRSVYGKITWKF